MATRSYNSIAQRAYGGPAGIRLIIAIESTGADPFTTTQAVRQGMEIGITSGHTRTLLHELAEGGWITRLKKGLYAINDPATKMPKAHPFAVGAAMVVPSAVSHWSALQHWGLTEQVPSTVTLSSPTRTFPPDDEGHSDTRHHGWIVGGLRYEFVAISRPRLFGEIEVWVSERNRVPIYPPRSNYLVDTAVHRIPPARLMYLPLGLQPRIMWARQVTDKYWVGWPKKRAPAYFRKQASVGEFHEEDWGS